MNKSLQDWLAEGDQIYQQTLSECRELESQLTDVEARLAAKREELSHLAQVMGKSPGAFGPGAGNGAGNGTGNGTGAAAVIPASSSAPSRQLNAELVEAGAPRSVPNSPTSIARALTGRGIGRYVPPPPQTPNAL